MLKVGLLSVNDLTELEEMSGYTIEMLGDDDLSQPVKFRIMAHCWWLQKRKKEPEFTLLDALDTPISEFVPGMEDL